VKRSEKGPKEKRDRYASVREKFGKKKPWCHPCVREYCNLDNIPMRTRRNDGRETNDDEGLVGSGSRRRHIKTRWGEGNRD